MEIQTKINSLNALLPQQVPFVMAQVSKALEIAEQSENFERNLDVAIAIAEQVSKFSGGDMLYNYTPILLALLKDSSDEATLAPFDTINHDVPIGIALVKQFLGTYNKRTKYAAGDLVNAQKNDNVCMVILANLLADIKAGKIYDSLVEDAKQNEKSDLKIRIANREAMIAGRGDSLNPMRFTELEEWKNRLKELDGAKEIGKGTDKPQVRKEKPVIDPELDIQIANLEKQISERKARLEELSVRENISFERFEIKDEKEIEEAIKKTEKISHKEQKNREKEERIYSQTHLTSALRLQTKQDLIANERKIRSQHVEDGLLRITNRIFRRNDEVAPDWVKTVIDVGVGITMKARNALDKWIYGEDKYDAELEAVKNSAVVITKETPRMEGQNLATPQAQKNVITTKNPKLKTKDPNAVSTDDRGDER